MNFLKYLWLIPLFPLIGSVVNGVFGRRFSKALVNVFALATTGASFLWAVGAVWQLARLLPEERIFNQNLFEWIPGGAALTAQGFSHFSIPWGYRLDPLSGVMILVVTGVGFLIHIYSTGYMAHEHGPNFGGYYRFFSYLNLFMFSMLTLVLANNFALMFVGWEGVGLCSYLLIGFYFFKKSAADAGKKAFIVNRIGDAGFMLGMFLIFQAFGSLDFSTVFSKAAAAPVEALGHVGVMTAIGLLLFLGATGKSAQLPLFTWLPDAMEGPTPVSALIHAATMVTAGVYMVARSSAIYTHAPTAMLVVAIVGALTAIFAASIGLVQNDIKRVLAYSTVSQLGYMFLACGVGAYFAGIFHLMTHAFFKALLFLGSGSVIHALSGQQDMRSMGGLKSKIPKTYWTMFVATVTIAGIPPFAGFFSKDEILWQAYSSDHGRWWLWLIGIVAALMTAFYMFRLIYLTFFNESHVDEETEHHIHESPSSMIVPLQILAVLSVVGGFVQIPKFLGGYDGFERWLEPVFKPGAVEAGSAAVEHAAIHGVGTEAAFAVLSVMVALLGIFVAYRFYFKPSSGPDRMVSFAPGVYNTLLHKYYVDEIYDALIVNRGKDLGNALWAFDRTTIDGGVNGSGWLTRFMADVSCWWDKWVVDGLVNVVGITVKIFSYPLRIIQTGFVQSYAFFMVLGLILLIWVYALK
ncbi:MAG: NADH-quinone oxidoreductase subunit L [Acidobacteriia bacterium]|nr:NADH-quinone oxidoreductase subunit L [Terriglobia bacterium]